MNDMIGIPLNTESPSEALADLLFKVKIKDVMTSPVITAAPEMTMGEIQKTMRELHFTGMPVVENGKILGIVSMNNLINAFNNDDIDAPCIKYLTKNVIVLREDMSVSFAVSYFNKYKFRRFPVITTDNVLTGIVTSYDVMASLLSAVSKEIERLETSAAESSPAAVIPQVIEFTTEPFNFETAGQASTEIKKLLKNMHVDPAVSRRAGIASYELEINQVVHSNGGIMRYIIDGNSLIIEAEDTGPGIPDLEKAMTEGFSTATDRVRALGFGAGMGLPNTRRVADSFDISSNVPSGTTVHARFDLTKNT